MGLALSLALIAAVSSCEQDSPAPGAGGATGVVALDLQVGPGVVITTATYVIGNTQTGFTSSGSVAVGKSADVPIPIAGLPIADRYKVTVLANGGDSTTVCRGETGFDVKANSRSTVIVRLVCSQPPQTGSIQVTGTFNVCPLLDGLSASPDHVVLGGTSSLTATAHDADNAPLALTYAWSATAGTFNSTTSPTSTFTCTQAGIATITVVVSDGDADPTCRDQLSLNVNCQVAQ